MTDERPTLVDQQGRALQSRRWMHWVTTTGLGAGYQSTTYMGWQYRTTQMATHPAPPPPVRPTLIVPESSRDHAAKRSAAHRERINLPGWLIGTGSQGDSRSYRISAPGGPFTGYRSKFLVVSG